MEYRVYQTMTEFATTVEAQSEEEAIKKATSKDNDNNWDAYEPCDDNITYEAVCQEETVECLHCGMKMESKEKLKNYHICKNK